MLESVSAVVSTIEIQQQESLFYSVLENCQNKKKQKSALNFRLKYVLMCVTEIVMCITLLKFYLL